MINSSNIYKSIRVDSAFCKVNGFDPRKDFIVQLLYCIVKNEINIMDRTLAVHYVSFVFYNSGNFEKGLKDFDPTKK